MVDEIEKELVPGLWRHTFALAPCADWHGMSGQSPGVTGIIVNTGDPDRRDKQYVVHTDGQLAIAPPGCTVIEDLPGTTRPASYAILVREDLIEHEPGKRRVLGRSVVEVHYDMAVDPVVLYDALAKILGEEND